MNGFLTPNQIADLAGISQICEELGADLVVIGATSLLILMGDLGRFTRDVDLTVALDFDEFERLTMRLAVIGWTQSPKLEHRWVAPRRTIIDLLPAGAELRRIGSITWPASQFKMSLAGFEHVFARAVEVHLPGGMTIRVAPPIVTALLKIIAWLTTRTGAPRISRIFVSFSAATNGTVIGCSPTLCSTRNLRISNSQTHSSLVSTCARWRTAMMLDSWRNFSSAFWLRTRKDASMTKRTSA